MGTIDSQQTFENPSAVCQSSKVNYFPKSDVKIDQSVGTSTTNESGEELQTKQTWGVIQSINTSDCNASVLDVAAYILDKFGEISTMKLHKLVYYCQAWSLVWDEKPLFSEPIEAWANGPVVRDLFNYHKGYFQISKIEIGQSGCLTENQKDTIDIVLNFYGDKSAQWLIDLTHMENPWLSARKGLSSLERGRKTISLESMAEYYSSL